MRKLLFASGYFYAHLSEKNDLNTTATETYDESRKKVFRNLCCPELPWNPISGYNKLYKMGSVKMGQSDLNQKMMNF
jgi:hypothetical protein